MNKTKDIRPAKESGDLVLREVWRAKDTLSAAYGHDLDKLFEETRKHEKLSGHPFAELPAKPRKTKPGPHKFEALPAPEEKGNE